ncbi:serine/threonine protein kinase [Cutibacterium equinum]|uniref:Serine/threonine protein kinase n=1 Tax=Cutibacterium equinum TaxID=3016342 RepID=A0ABY7QZJ2_9ACTN|nr:serine/threonine protein kinase [Cutibacterium equinum]WCC79954.1 serine/threonine protein kinase [Cutibacterium equinum]
MSFEDPADRDGDPFDPDTPAVDDLPDLLPGSFLGGRYRLDQELSHPDSSLTWRAFDTKLHRPVLIHALAPHGRRTPAVLDAARRAAVATDSRFLRILDAVVAGPDEPASWVVSEYAPGKSVQELLESGPLSALEAAWIAHEIADAMAPLHAQGVFHERIDPGTVLVTSTGNLKISGLLIEAALHPLPGDNSRPWPDREVADVTDIGRVLYACLVSRWPVGRGHQPSAKPTSTMSWGLPPAPTDPHGWLTPREVRAGVSPALDVLCDQILSQVPRYDEVPLHTATEIARSLRRTLGSADAAADLERRIRFPVGPASRAGQDPRAGQEPWRSDEPVAPASGQDQPERAEEYGPDDEGYWSPDAAAGEWGRQARPVPWSSNEEPHTTQLPPAGQQRPTDSSDEPVLTKPRPHNRRWPPVLMAVVGVIMIVCLIVAGVRHSGSTAPEASSEPTTIKVTHVQEFDPAADGGDAKENHDEVAFAIDGNPSTVWHTLVYHNSAKLGNLKPGVGLVIDVGRVTEIASVNVQLLGSGTNISLWQPTSDVSSGEPPMTSIKEWTQVAAVQGAGSTVTLKPSGKTKTRHLLIYLTELPPKSTARFQGGIADITVTGS